MGSNLDFQANWEVVKSRIISKNQSNQFLLRWFVETELVGVQKTEQDCVFQLSVPTVLHHYWISQNLLEIISCEISAIYTEPFHIDILIVKTDKYEDTAVAEQTTSVPAVAEVKMASPPNKDALNPEYTFSTFVVGRNNEFAHAISHTIANNPGAENYNPLFICGPTGMGKTHLLNAVGNHIKERFPETVICYCSAEKFLNECISSIRRNEMHKFRQKYRDKCHILLMDDIQILGRGEAVQEEFFHTLNDFFDKGQQVIVASDRMPKDIMGLEDRIRTRLEWGLIADIQMPDLETRMAILRYKAEKRAISLSTEVVTYIARISKTSIRQLEGNLNTIKMFAELQSVPISLDLCRKILASHDDTRNLTIDELQKMVAEQFKVRIVDLKAKSRTQPLVMARQISMYLMKKHLDKSLVEIGRAHGGKDHSTVISALRRVDDQLSTNPDLRKVFNDLETSIHNITGV